MRDLRRATRSFFLLALIIALGLASCSSDGSGGGSNSGDTAGDDVLAGDGISETQDVSEEEVAPTPTDPEDFRVVWGYQGRIAGDNIDEFDLWMAEPDGSSALNLTGENLPPLGLTCEFGCVVDEDMKYIAVSTHASDQGQFTFKFGQITADLSVRLDKGGIIEDVVELKFAGDYLFYSTRVGCKNDGKNCQYKLLRVDLVNDVANAVELGVFPPDSDPDYDAGQTTYQGHFHVAPDGESVIILSPTIRSIRVYTLSQGLLHQLDFICQHLDAGVCSGVGSWYTDRDPVAISHDSRWVVFFTQADKDFVARLYDLENPGSLPRLSFLMSVPTESIKNPNVACANKAPWQFLEISGVPRFTPDDQAVVVVGRSNCTTPERPRPETNIYRIPLAVIGDGTPIEEADLQPLLAKPVDDVVENIIVHDMAFSPEGRWIVFTGSPMFQTSGEYIPMSSSRASNDKEVYVLDPSTQEVDQITNAVEYRAEGIFTTKPRVQ